MIPTTCFIIWGCISFMILLLHRWIVPKDFDLITTLAVAVLWPPLVVGAIVSGVAILLWTVGDKLYEAVHGKDKSKTQKL